MTRSIATILAAVDGSPASLRAVAYAAGIARRERARLILVHVRQPTAMARIAAALSAETIAAAWADPRPGEFARPSRSSAAAGTLRPGWWSARWPVVVIP